MQRLKGKPISRGYADGRAFLYDRKTAPEPPRHDIAPDQVAHEHERLFRAIRGAIAELEEIEQRVLVSLGEAESRIFASHLALLRDQDFLSKVQNRIQRELVNAEPAIEQELNVVVEILAKTDSEYLRERVHDLHDVQHRVFKHLGYGPESVLTALPPGSVLVSHELLPSDTLNLDRDQVAGIVLELGGATSHAAILARALGIPAVGGVRDAVTSIEQGAFVLVDGDKGEIVVEPGAGEMEVFTSQCDRFARECSITQNVEDKEHCVTLDGRSVTLFANIGRAEEVGLVKEYRLAGVGLFRTEYLFLESIEPPDLATQRDLYVRILAQVPHGSVVIRTLDLGGDKIPSFPMARFHGNTGFGLRGLRFSLLEGDLLRVQLRAIMEAATGRKDVAILFPLVTSASELEQAIEMAHEVAKEAGIRSLPQLGAMIETPAAVFEVAEILELVDFASIGTNDLSQFMLASDRRAIGHQKHDPFFQPSVLRAVAQIAWMAQEMNKPLSVCGEAGGSPASACLLVGLGIDKLSMSANRSSAVRHILQTQRFSELRALAQRALAARSREGVAEIVSAVCPV